MVSATVISWVLRMTVAPERRRSRMASRSVSALTGSSPVKGSSRIRSLGSGTTAAMNEVPQVEPRHPGSDFLAHLAPAAQFAEELQQGANLHLAVKAAFLGEV